MVAYVIVPDTVSFMPGSYVRRVIDTELDELFPQLPAIVLDGPKGVGKTATTEQRCSSIRRLDIAGQRAVLEADPSLVGQDPKPVLIDEWQRLPAVRDAVWDAGIVLGRRRSPPSAGVRTGPDTHGTVNGVRVTSSGDCGDVDRVTSTGSPAC